MRITSGGNVGIGTCSPSGTGIALNVKGVIGNTVSMVIAESQDAGAMVSLYSGAASNDDPSLIYLKNLRFGSGNKDTSGYVERMRISSCGCVGIGTQTPAAFLHVAAPSGAGSNTMIRMEKLAGYGTSDFILKYESTYYTGGSTLETMVGYMSMMKLITNNAYTVGQIQLAYPTGIGTDSPKSQFDVACGTARSTITSWCKNSTCGTMYSAFNIVTYEASFAGELYVQAAGSGLGIQATYDVLSNYDKICIIPRNSINRGQGEALTIASYAEGAGSKAICIRQTNTSGTGMHITAMLVGTSYGGNYICGIA
jgi:hypothetical protein